MNGRQQRKREMLPAYIRDIPDRDSVIGFGGPVTPDLLGKRNVLITGAGSYIGESFRDYAKEHYADNFEIDTIDMRNEDWGRTDFSRYDVVFHVAGIAHADVGHMDKKIQKQYYAVNTNLAIEVAKKAKDAGVKLFIFMSSMIIYGDSAPYGKKKVIMENTRPAPDNFYGDSKWQADKGIRSLADGGFRTVILRPPMIYGKGSKGNYPTLAKIAQRLCVFPDIVNQKSMLYIENFCELTCQCMLAPMEAYSDTGNIFFPQNAEYTKTADMVRKISYVHGRKIRICGWVNPVVWISSKMVGKIGKMVNKAFGSSRYKKEISQYEGIDYQKVGLEESIKRTELGKFRVQRKKVLFLVNHDIVIYNFRFELVERLLECGFEVNVSSPYGERINKLQELGCIYHVTEIERHGRNPLKEVRLLKAYQKLVEEVNPDIVLTYTVKPNVYGGMVCSRLRIPYIANVTGLGTALENGGLMQKITLALYKQGLKKAQIVFFQNRENMVFMTKKGVVGSRYALLPGSGVNLEQFSYMEYPQTDDPVVFVTVGRLMKDKGTDELLEAAGIVRECHPHVVFRLIGDYDEEIYKDKVNRAVKNGTIEYFGSQPDVRPFLKECHALIHASYHEGMSNALLEAAASGRPVIATDVPGCREAFDSDISGIACKAGDVKSLVDAVERFLEMPHAKKQQMGQMGRKKMEAEFDRRIIVDEYMKELKKAVGARD